MKYVLNCRKLVQHLGGAKALAEAHESLRDKYGYDPLPEATVRSWIRNNGLSTPKLLELKTISGDMGKSFVFTDFCDLEAK